jgi:hypothetical protein
MLASKYDSRRYSQYPMRSCGWKEYGPQIGWCSCLFTYRREGTSYIDPIRRLLAGQKVVIFSSRSSHSTVVVYGAARLHGLHDPGFNAVAIQYTPASKLINVTRSLMIATHTSRNSIGSCGSETKPSSPTSTFARLLPLQRLQLTPRP